MFLGKFQDVRIKLVHQGFHCFPCCPEVVKINELSFVFKSLEMKNFGACRSSHRCLLECSSDYWFNHGLVARRPSLSYCGWHTLSRSYIELHYYDFLFKFSALWQVQTSNSFMFLDVELLL